MPFSLILSLSSFNPALPPLVCCVVLSVSTGVRIILKHAEATLAATVLTKTGQVNDSKRAIIPALAAVSPNRENGPWNLHHKHLRGGGGLTGRLGDLRSIA